MILSLIIHDTVNNVHPVYEVHTWEKAQEIINSTKELMGETPFTWEVVGNSGN